MLKYLKNEVIDGYKVTCESGFYIAKNDDVTIVFTVRGGEGLYFNIDYIYNHNTMKTYRSPRYHYKYIIPIREIAFELAKRGCVWNYKENCVYKVVISK